MGRWPLIVILQRQHLNLKPGLNETVGADLPAHCSFETDKPVPPSTVSSNRKPKKKNKHFMENISDRISHLTYSLQCDHGEEGKDMQQQRYELLVKDDKPKDWKSTMFQYMKR